MNKFFLKAESKEALWAALESAGIVKRIEGGDRPYEWPGFDLDEIGVIQKGGEYDEEGNEIVAPTVLDGYHMNGIGVRTEEQIAALADIEIPEPANRLRYWAGEVPIVLPVNPEPEPAPEEPVIEPPLTEEGDA